MVRWSIQGYMYVRIYNSDNTIAFTLLFTLLFTWSIVKFKARHRIQ